MVGLFVLLEVSDRARYKAIKRGQCESVGLHKSFFECLSLVAEGVDGDQGALVHILEGIVNEELEEDVLRGQQLLLAFSNSH